MSPSDRFAAATREVDRALGAMEGAGRLAPSVVAGYRNGQFKQGWQLPVADFPDGVTRVLHILISTDFPYAAPRIAVSGAPPMLTWPHLEAGALLCLDSDHRPIPEHPMDMVRVALRDAYQLISSSIRGDNQEDFRAEFLSYWSQVVAGDAQRVTSLLCPRGPSRAVATASRQSQRILADCREDLDHWMKHAGIGVRDSDKLQRSRAAFLWLPEPLLPTEYPHSGADVLKIADAAEGRSVVEDVLGSTDKSIDIVIGAPTDRGTVLAHLTVYRPPLCGPRGRRRDGVLEGFRAQTIPPRQLVNRFFAPTAEVYRRNVARADHAWVHGRDQDPAQGRLRDRRVAVIGCGSVGGAVARNLAQAGVGNLLLVDPERLEWPNVGRHVLGGADVGCAKAQALRRNLERSFPHLNSVLAREGRIAPAAEELMREIHACDLVVSAMGDWEGESFLNEWQQESDDRPSVLFGWLEPAASAAHAVLCASGGPCLRCGTHDNGRPIRSVTSWSEDGGLLQEPGCGATFTPYGPARLSWGHALVTEVVLDYLQSHDGDLATHHVSIGRRTDVEAAGGQWSREWIDTFGDPGDGGFRMTATWRRSASCPICNQRASAA